MLKKEDLEFKDKFAVFPLKEVNDNTNTIIEGEEKVFQQKFRELFIYNANPFLDAAKNGDEKDLELIKKSPGTPLFYRDFNNGAYVIAIINESFEFQYLDKKTMIFLANMVNKGKIIRKKENKGIDEQNIIQLDLQRLDLGPLEIAYLIGYNLVNLRILDLSCNSLRGLGSFYLGKGNFNSLGSLNLNFNEIGDGGLYYIANGNFSKLNSLFLYNDNISSEGIKSLISAKFIKNLMILSLSENPKIGDIGVRYMKEYKGWDNLTILNLNYVGLTDISLNYFLQSYMPKLKN